MQKEIKPWSSVRLKSLYPDLSQRAGMLCFTEISVEKTSRVWPLSIIFIVLIVMITGLGQTKPFKSNVLSGKLYSCTGLERQEQQAALAFTEPVLYPPKIFGSIGDYRIVIYQITCDVFSALQFKGAVFCSIGIYLYIEVP